MTKASQSALRQAGVAPSALPAGVGPFAVSAAFIAMLAWTWLKWPDPLIDFGRELYLAWQVSEGQTLYHDVEHFNGPLSVYLNALVFRVFGPGIQTLVYANIAVAGLILTLIYALIRQTSDSLTAAVCGIVFATLFACVQFVDTGNYNFITPYSHEVTHGMLLALAAIGSVLRLHDTRKWGFAIAAGILLGLLWLTKLELFLAAAAAVGAGLCFCRPLSRPIAVATALIATIVIAFVLLLTQLPFGDAFRGTMGSAYYVFDNRLASLPFYQRVSGLDDGGTNLLIAVASAAALGLLLATARLLGRMTPPGNAGRWAAGLAVGAGPVIIIWLTGWLAALQLMLRGLPIVLAVMLVVCIRQTRSRAARGGAVAQLVWLTFSLLLTAKIVLHVSVEHYGFVLAMPATLAMVASLLSWVPWKPSQSAKGSAPPKMVGDARAFGLIFVGLYVVSLLVVYARLFADKPIHISSGGNAFLAAAGSPQQASRGDSLAALVANIDRLAPPTATIAAVPEGAMINFLTHRRNPTPFITLQPPEYLMFGADRITQAYLQSPPDFVVINLTVDPAEYGSRGFDQDYGKALADFVKQNYVPVWRDGPHGRLILLARNR